MAGGPDTVKSTLIKAVNDAHDNDEILRIGRSVKYYFFIGGIRCN